MISTYNFLHHFQKHHKLFQLFWGLYIGPFVNLAIWSGQIKYHRYDCITLAPWYEICLPASYLTGNFFLNHTDSCHEKFLFLIFFGLYVKTTCLYLPNKMFDPLVPWGHPQGVPQFQLQYIKLNPPSHVAILILFTYMVANGV